MSSVLSDLWNQHQALPPAQRPAFYQRFLWPALRFRLVLAGARQRHALSIHLLETPPLATVLAALYLRSERVVVLCTPQQQGLLGDLERELGRTVEPRNVPELEGVHLQDALEGLWLERPTSGEVALVLHPQSSRANRALLAWERSLRDGGVSTSVFTLEGGQADKGMLHPLEVRMVGQASAGPT